MCAKNIYYSIKFGVKCFGLNSFHQYVRQFSVSFITTIILSFYILLLETNSKTLLLIMFESSAQQSTTYLK